MARKAKPKPTFMELPRRKQSLAVSRLYLTKCTLKSYLTNGKPNKDYICIARWLECKQDINLVILYTYLDSIQTKQIMDLGAVIYNAKRYNDSLISQSSRVQEKVDEYQDYDMSMLEGL